MSYKERKRTKANAKFTLVGTLVKVIDGAILVQKVNSKARFWVDTRGYEGEMVNIDKNATFLVTISTYIGNDPDKVIRTKIRLYDIISIEGEVQEDHPGFIGTISGTALDYIETDVENMNIVKFLDDKGTHYYLKTYGLTGFPLDHKMKIDLDLRSTTILCNLEGKTFTQQREINYTDKTTGEHIEKKVDVWFPVLEVKEHKIKG